MGFSNDQVCQQLKKSRGISIVLQISLPGSFPRGQRENISRMRIQTPAEGVNNFAKAMGRQTESWPECDTQGDFHPTRQDGRQNG
jgi:hypothetical protein